MQQLIARPAFDAPYYVLSKPARRLGSVDTGQVVSQGASIAVTAATGEIAAIVAGTSLVIPIIGPALAAVALGVNLILHSGCGQTCVQTSSWANQAEQLLIQNIQAYFALPAPRSNQAKAVALSAFDNVWNGLVQRCSQQGLGPAGQNCIQDRQAGSCKWKQTTTSPLLQYPGEPQPGECWNWFSGYRDPIANDPTVDASVAGAAASTTSGGGFSLSSLTSGSGLLLLGAAGLLLLAASGGKN